MRVYVASGLENIERAKLVVDELKRRGHIIGYEWTKYGDVRGQSEDILMSTAREEAFAVIDSALVLIMLPGGRGTHIELGLALASRNNKRIILWSETGEEFGNDSKTCVFYHHMSIERLQCSLDELLKLVRTL